MDRGEISDIFTPVVFQKFPQMLTWQFHRVAVDLSATFLKTLAMIAYFGFHMQ